MRAVEGLIRLSLNAEEVFSNVVGQSWVLDGTHKRVLITLGGLSNYSGTRLRFLEHPAIADGISEEEAVRLAVVTRVATLDEERADRRYDELFAAKLFDEERITVEAFVVNLPLAGNVRVYIVQEVPEYTPLAQMVEDSMQTYENFLSAPFPTEVMYFSAIERNPELGPGQGGLGGAYQVSTDRLSRTTGQDPLSFFADILGFVGHEMGHFYFNGLSPWISEGGASFLAGILQNESYGLVDPQEGVVYCTESNSKNIAEWEMHGQGLCHYALGAGLFQDLYENLDELSLRVGIRNVYLYQPLRRSGEAPAGCAAQYPAICYVRSAFNDGVSPSDARKANDIIDDWYSGENPLGLPDLRRVSGVVLGPAGKPIEWMWVRVVDAHSRWRSDTWDVSDVGAQTTTDGIFEASVKPGVSGEFFLSISPGLQWDCRSSWLAGSDGLSPRFSDEPTPFELGENDVTGIVVRLPAEPEQLCNRITGTVVGPDGRRPDYEAVVVSAKVVGWDSSTGTRTDGDGVFTAYTPVVFSDHQHHLSVVVSWGGKSCWVGYYNPEGLTPDRSKATGIDVSTGPVSDVVIRLPGDLCGR